VPHLTRDQILAKDDLRFEDVDVPEWGGSVRVRELRASEREVFERRVFAAGSAPSVSLPKTLGDLRVSLVVKCLVDPSTGSRLFKDEDAKDLNEKSATVIARLFSVCSRISGISQEVVDAVVGESEATTGGASS